MPEEPFHLLAIDGYTMSRSGVDRWEIREPGSMEPIAAYGTLRDAVIGLMVRARDTPTVQALLEVFTTTYQTALRDTNTLHAADWHGSPVQ